MTTEIFTKVTLGITELKVNPIQVAEHDMVCVLSRSKPAFYTVSVTRMNELLAAEEQFENGYLNGVADSRMGQKRIRVDLDDLDATQ